MPDNQIPRCTPKVDVGRLDEADRRRLERLSNSAQEIAETLDGSDPLTRDEIAERTDYKETTVSKATGRLVANDLINRVPYIPDPQKAVFYIPSEADQTGARAGATDDAATRLRPDGGP